MERLSGMILVNKSLKIEIKEMVPEGVGFKLKGENTVSEQHLNT